MQTSRLRNIVSAIGICVLLLFGLWIGLSRVALSAPDREITINPVYQTTTTQIISGGTTSSAAVDLMGGRLVAIVMPEAWTAAALSMQGSADATNYYDVYDDSGNEITITVGASRHVVLDDLSNVAGLRWVKIRSGTTGTPVTQASTRTITLTVRP